MYDHFLNMYKRMQKNTYIKAMPDTDKSGWERGPIYLAFRDFCTSSKSTPKMLRGNGFSVGVSIRIDKLHSRCLSLPVSNCCTSRASISTLIQKFWLCLVLSLVCSDRVSCNYFWSLPLCKSGDKNLIKICKIRLLHLMQCSINV